MSRVRKKDVPRSHKKFTKKNHKKKKDARPVKRGRKPSAEPDDDFLDDELFDSSKSPIADLENQPIDEDALTASICRDSFFEFVMEFWEEISARTPVWNWHIKYLCDVMQEIAERVMKDLPKKSDLVVNIPPGTTKSSICSVLFPAWVWTKMPHARFLCVSHTQSLAHELARFSRDVVMSTKYRKLYPGIRLREDQNTKGMYLNSLKGYRFSIGAQSSVIGRHVDFIIVDDPIDPESALSETEMPAINNWLSVTLDSRKTEKLISVMILIMQRIAEEDPSADKMKREPETAQIVFPADISDPHVADLVKPPEMKEKYVDGLLDPIRLSRAHLAPFRRKGTLYFSAQWDQNPGPPDGGMFHTDKIKITKHIPAEWRRLVRFWDKAGTEAGGAFSVGTLMGEDLAQYMWILDVARGQWDSATREDKILGTAMLDGRKTIVGVEQEGGSGGKESAERTKKMLTENGFICRIIIPKGDKVLRADPFSSAVNAGHVYMREAAWNLVFLNEMKHFPNTKYKDQVDSASGAYTIHTKPLVTCGVIGKKKGQGTSPSRFFHTPGTVEYRETHFDN